MRAMRATYTVARVRLGRMSPSLKPPTPRPRPPASRNANQEEDTEPDEKGGHGNPDPRAPHDEPVDPPAPAVRGRHAERDRHEHGEHDGAGREGCGRLDPIGDQRAHRL